MTSNINGYNIKPEWFLREKGSFGSVYKARKRW